MNNFVKTLIVVLLLIAIFVTTLCFSNAITNWFDKTFVSKDSKIVGEWQVESVELIRGNERIKVTAEEFEDFYLNYDSSTASELEEDMYSMADDVFAREYEFKKDNTMEISLINENEEKEVVETFNWTFKKGIITMENEDQTITCEYNEKGTIGDTELSDGTILRQTMVRK